MSSASYFNYWGKASRDDGSYHLLPYHCLDVAAVGHVILEKNSVYLNHFLGMTGLDKQEFIPWSTFLLALHDIGKFADSFQNLSPAIMQTLRNRTSDRVYGERHDSLGWLFWKKHLRQLFIDSGLIEVSGTRRRQTADQPIDLWLAAMVGHHGQPPKPDLQHPAHSYLNETDDFAAASEFMEDLIPLLLGDRTIFPKCDMQAIRLTSWWLSGLAVLCDWLGSNTDYFPYRSEQVTLSDYWDYSKKRAEVAIREAELVSSSSSLSLTLGDLLAAEYGVKPELTPLQQLVSNRNITDSPHLFILEDVTGAGKTEAAVLLAHRLMQAGHGNSLYFALPTMATANSMYTRMKDVYRKLFADESTPSLVLAHGARDMSKEFRQSVLPELPATTDNYGDGTIPAGTHCNAWLADNRKKALLADIGIGTIDQALLAILPARHQSLRLLGLVNKILIVDEVHACDAYMHELLCALLRAHAAAGGSVVLLSATLPKKQRQALLNAYAQGRGWSKVIPEYTNNTSYPLASCLNSAGLNEAVVATRESVRREVKIDFLSDSATVESLLEDSVAKGQCACWIRNTVKDAIEAYQEIKNRHPDWNVDLFHARYALVDRIEIEARVVQRFDKKSTTESRKGQILIATQVVEQSLDLDFDTLITDLAPIDLIIQRAGRLRRHTRDKTGNRTSGKDQRGNVVLHIHSPVMSASPNANWYSDYFPNAQMVYENHGQLWLTASHLYQNGKFGMPEDARMLIEGVYGTDAQDEIPEALLHRSNEAEGGDRANASVARLNALSMDVGYTDASTNRWWDEAKTPTRLGEETTMVYLAKWQDGVLRPWSDNKEHAWPLSAVSMRTWWIAAEKLTGEITQELIDICKSAMPAKGKWGVLLPLTQKSNNDWQGLALNEKQEIVHFIYNEKFGLMVDSEPAQKDAKNESD